MYALLFFQQKYVIKLVSRCTWLMLLIPEQSIYTSLVSAIAALPKLRNQNSMLLYLCGLPTVSLLYREIQYLSSNVYFNLGNGLEWAIDCCLLSLLTVILQLHELC
jgi:hypothetical protein